MRKIVLAAVLLGGCSHSGSSGFTPGDAQLKAFNHDPAQCPALDTPNYYLPPGGTLAQSIETLSDPNGLPYILNLPVGDLRFDARPDGVTRDTVLADSQSHLSVRAGCEAGAAIVSYAGVIRGKTVSDQLRITLAGQGIQVVSASGTLNLPVAR